MIKKSGKWYRFCLELASISQSVDVGPIVVWLLRLSLPGRRRQAVIVRPSSLGSRRHQVVRLVRQSSLSGRCG